MSRGYSSPRFFSRVHHNHVYFRQRRAFIAVLKYGWAKVFPLRRFIRSPSYSKFGAKRLIALWRSTGGRGWMHLPTTPAHRWIIVREAEGGFFTAANFHSAVNVPGAESHPWFIVVRKRDLVIFIRFALFAHQVSADGEIIDDAFWERGPAFARTHGAGRHTILAILVQPVDTRKKIHGLIWILLTFLVLFRQYR